MMSFNGPTRVSFCPNLRMDQGGCFFPLWRGVLLDRGVPPPSLTASTIMPCLRGALARLGDASLGVVRLLLRRLGQKLGHSPLHSLFFAHDWIWECFEECGCSKDFLARPSELMFAGLGVNDLAVNVSSTGTRASSYRLLVDLAVDGLLLQRRLLAHLVQLTSPFLQVAQLLGIWWRHGVALHRPVVRL